MSAAPLRPLPMPTRAQWIEALARRAEELQAMVPASRDAPLVDLVAEMAREMYRMAHALDGVV